MGIFSKLFKKKEEDKYDFQAEYLKEEKEKSKSAPKKKAAEAPAKKAESAKAPAKADAKKAEAPAKKTETSKAPVKKAAPLAAEKPAAKAEAPKEEMPSEEAIDAVLENTETLESKSTRNGNFDVKKAQDGRFFFALYASNRQEIARSQMYSSSTSAVNGIKSVIANSPKAEITDISLKNPTTAAFPKWEIYLDRAGQYRFRLYASNGNCVCHSHGYTTRQTCKGGIESIKRFAQDAEVNKLYLN